MGSRIPVEIPFGRVGLAIFILLIIGLGLTMGLRGAVKPETIRVVNASSNNPIPYGEPESSTVVGYDENFSRWKLGGDSSVTAELDNNSTLLSISGLFHTAPASTSVFIFKNVNIDIASFQIFEAHLNVSTGVGYGIRFFSRYTNETRYNVWWEGSALDHRSGMEYEKIRANMQRQALLATGHQVTYITGIEIYVELGPNTERTFRLTLEKIDFIRETLKPLENGNEYRAIYLDLSTVPQENASWLMNKINLGVTLVANPGSVYTIYLVNYLSVYQTQPFIYDPSTASYQYTFYPNQPKSLFPELLPPSNASITFVASSGSLEKLSVSQVDFVFLPSENTRLPITTQTLQDAYSCFLLFLFLLPIGTALLVFHHLFRQRVVTKFSVASVLCIGLACRLVLAATTAHIFDATVYISSARAWFQYGDASGSLGPTLPLTFFLYWMGYSPYALLQVLGFQDFALGHVAGPVELIFIKMFPIVSDVAVFALLMRFENSGRAFVWSSFYFLNPLSIFISAMWGQYEAATIGFIVLGFYWLHDQKITRGGVAFVISGLIELFGFVPYLILILVTAWTRKFRLAASLLSIAAIAFVSLAEADLLYRLVLAYLGVTHSLTYSTPGIYTLFGSFLSLSFTSGFHPLLLSGAAILTGVVLSNYTGRSNVNSLVLSAGISLISVLLFSGPLAAWLMLIPIAIVYSILRNKDSLASFTLVFGTALTFVMVSYTAGSAYFLLGNVGYAILPSLEAIRHGLQIFTVMATFLAVAFVYYFLFAKEGRVERTMIATSIIIVSAYVLTYYWLGVFSS
jgi:hypothetical protein